MWHNPKGGKIGACVAHPATPFYLGPQPVQRSAIQTAGPPQFVDAVKAFVPVTGDEDGCWEHKARGQELIQ